MLAVTDEYYLESGGYYKKADNSGPYFISSNGKAVPLSGDDSGGGGSIPIGLSTQVLGYDAQSNPSPVSVRMDHWLGADQQLSGNVGSLIPGVEVTPGQKVSTGKTRFYGVTNGTTAISIPIRDSGGILSANAGTGPKTLTNLEQVQGMIGDAVPKGVQYQIAAFDDKGALTGQPLNLSHWTGAATGANVASKEVVPFAMYNATGDGHSNSYREAAAVAMESSLMMRDAFGRTQINEAIYDNEAVNLKQLKAAVIEDAPNDGNMYVRQNGKWVNING